MLPFVPLCALTADRQWDRTHYQVLNISPDEQEPKVIEEAALRCSGHVRIYQLTHPEECTLRLNEIAQALVTLLDPVHRRAYDRGLSKPLSPVLLERPPTQRRDTPVLMEGKNTPAAAGEDKVVLVISAGRACDLKLVCRKLAA